MPVLGHDRIAANSWHLRPGGRILPTVCIFGPMKTGTNALAAYLRRFFHVNVMPTARITGYVQLLPRVRVWKHHVPCDPYPCVLLPQRSPPGSVGSEVIVLLTVREIRPLQELPYVRVTKL